MRKHTLFALCIFLSCFSCSNNERNNNSRDYKPSSYDADQELQKLKILVLDIESKLEELGAYLGDLESLVHEESYQTCKDNLEDISSYTDSASSVAFDIEDDMESLSRIIDDLDHEIYILGENN